VRKVFTPFYKLWQKYLEANSELKQVSYTPTKIISPTIYCTPRSQIEPHLGGDAAPLWSASFPQNRLEYFDFTQYDEKRNIPSYD
jgi:deoxyribodipyrimidine photolyase